MTTKTRKKTKKKKKKKTSLRLPISCSPMAFINIDINLPRELMCLELEKKL